MRALEGVGRWIHYPAVAQSYQAIRSLRSLPERKLGTYRAIFARVMRAKHSRHAGGRGLYCLAYLMRSVASHFDTILRLTDIA